MSVTIAGGTRAELTCCVGSLFSSLSVASDTEAVVVSVVERQAAASVPGNIIEVFVKYLK